MAARNSTNPQAQPLRRASEYGDVESIGIQRSRQERRAEAVKGAAVVLAGLRGGEGRVPLEKGGDDVLIFVMAHRTRGIQEQAASFQAGGVRSEDFQLGFGERGDRLRFHIPLEVRLAAPGPGPGTRSV